MRIYIIYELKEKLLRDYDTSLLMSNPGKKGPEINKNSPRITRSKSNIDKLLPADKLEQVFKEKKLKKRILLVIY